MGFYTDSPYPRSFPRECRKRTIARTRRGRIARRPFLPKNIVYSLSPQAISRVYRRGFNLQPLRTGQPHGLLAPRQSRDNRLAPAVELNRMPLIHDLSRKMAVHLRHRIAALLQTVPGMARHMLHNHPMRPNSRGQLLHLGDNPGILHALTHPIIESPTAVRQPQKKGQRPRNRC